MSFGLSGTSRDGDDGLCPTPARPASQVLERLTGVANCKQDAGNLDGVLDDSSGGSLGERLGNVAMSVVIRATEREEHFSG
jgi:hypothetical protein